MKRIVWLSLSIAMVALLAAVAMILIPILTHQNTGSSGQTQPEGFISEVVATGEDGRTRTLTALTVDGDPFDLSSLTPGQIVIVEGAGYNTSGGIYVGFCVVPKEADTRPSPCLGGIPEDAQEEKSENISDEALESAWVTNNWAWRAFASHTYTDKKEGTFRVKLVVPESVTEGLDCKEQDCGLYTRADHTALSERVQDLFLPIRFTD